jgi:hypothetical protein
MPRSPARSLTSTAASPTDTSLDPPRDAEELRPAGARPFTRIGSYRGTGHATASGRSGPAGQFGLPGTTANQEKDLDTAA